MQQNETTAKDYFSQKCPKMPENAQKCPKMPEKYNYNLEQNEKKWNKNFRPQSSTGKGLKSLSLEKSGKIRKFYNRNFCQKMSKIDNKIIWDKMGQNGTVSKAKELFTLFLMNS